MPNNMDKNTLIKLKTFQGTSEPSIKVKHRENYWKLIGEKGVVLEDADFNLEKVLVL